MGTPDLIREVIGIQDRMLADLDAFEERVRGGEDRSTVERESSTWAGDDEVYWELHDAMSDRIAESETEAARMPLGLAHELLDLRWRRADLISEVDTFMRTEAQISRAREEIFDCEERIKEIEDILALMGPGPCAPSLEVVSAGFACLSSVEKASTLAR